MGLMRIVAVVMGAALLVSSCAPASQMVSAFPARGQSVAQQALDTGECEQWAAQQSGHDPGGSAVTGAAGGAALGAGAGALLGAVVYSVFGLSASEGAWRGAALGATEGALTGAAQGAASNVWRYQNAYAACMSARGYQVSLPGYAASPALAAVSDRPAPAREDAPAPPTKSQAAAPAQEGRAESPATARPPEEAQVERAESVVRELVRHYEPSSLEAQLDSLQDLKTRGKITDEEYPLLRRRLVETFSFVQPSQERVIVVTRPAEVRKEKRADPLAWLLGTWEGVHSAPTISVDRATFEITREKDKIVWRMSRRTVIRSWRGNLTASGTVVSVTETNAELSGSYEPFSEGHTAGKPLTYSLRWDGETLQGFAVGVEDVPFRVSLRRTR